jgi:toxin HigB-1
VIESFRDKTTAAVFQGEFPKRMQRDVAIRARSKLLVIEAASRLEDMRSPPGNRLEALKGDRIGQHSIRINDQFRICFVWRDGHAFDVEIADYH